MFSSRHVTGDFCLAATTATGGAIADVFTGGPQPGRMQATLAEVDVQSTKALDIAT